MDSKIIGYIFLFLGIFIILFSTISVYLVYTKQMEPVKLFILPPISFDLASIMSASLPEELRGQMPSSQQELISADMVNVPMNLFAHVILMGFIASAGLKISQIGTMLLRPIVVQVKETKQ